MESIRLEKVYNAPLESVWKAITEKEQLRKWYFDFSEDWKLVPGHQFEWYAGPPDGNKWLHRGKMIEIITNKKLVHTWEYPGYKGISTITWELSPVDANTTRLNFTHEFTEPFDETVEALRRGNFVQGWNHIINTGLAGFLKTNH
jgi:uncharacterized protein YndB with AHSA1/START domain